MKPRDYKYEDEWQAKKYKRIVLKVDRAKWEALTAERRGEIMRELREMAKREVGVNDKQ